MTYQEIIDTYNYSAVTGCRLSQRAADKLYTAVLAYLSTEANGLGTRHPLYIDVAHDIPAAFTTFTGYRPKTKMLYGNYCELELLRILYLLKPDQLVHRPLFEASKKRLRQSCFGSFCATGEGFEVSIVALRFIATVFPEEKPWIDMYISKIAETMIGHRRKVSRRTVLMFCQVLSELRRKQDNGIIDDLITLIDDRHLPEVSKASAEINDCIFYSSLRRTAMAS